MKRFAQVLTVLLTLAAFVVGLGGGTVALDVYQPANAKETQAVPFEVVAGDTTNSVAQRLQDEGLIRNALVFRLWARVKKLDRGVQAGVYSLSPSMSMNQVILKLQNGLPDVTKVTVIDGSRLTQYPDYFKGMPNFKAADFLTISKTGILPDKTKLWEKYWFVPQPTAKVAYALEGYLYPSTYYFNKSDDAQAVIERMLTQFAEELCPGTANAPDAYIGSAATCRQHAVKTDNGQNIFDAMRKAYPDAKTDAQALHDAMIIASITAREIKNYSDAPGVAGVYHNRYLSAIGKLPSDTAGFLDADPTVQYARDNDHPPAAGGKWYTAIKFNGSLADLDGGNPYNTYANKGLPPGPIANPEFHEIMAGANPPASKYFYFVTNASNQVCYAQDNNTFQANLSRWLTSKTCN